jgi:hypothetical protein
VGFRIGELKEAIGDKAHDGAEARAGESAHGD